MNARIKHGGLLAVLVGTAAISAAFASQPFPFRPESRLWVEGTSTVRGWRCEAAELKGAVDAAPGELTIAGLQEAVRGVVVTVPVEKLECGNATMDSHLYKALKGQQHPSIEFRLASHEVTASGSDRASAKLAGRLSIAGQERPVTLEGIAIAAEGGAVRVRGTEEVVMSEFGVKPPSLMMGTMKVGDKVKVHFDVVLKP